MRPRLLTAMDHPLGLVDIVHTLKQVVCVIAHRGLLGAMRLLHSGTGLIGLHADTAGVLWAVTWSSSAWSLGNAGTALELTLPSIATLPFAFF